MDKSCESGRINGAAHSGGQPGLTRALLLLKHQHQQQRAKGVVDKEEDELLKFKTLVGTHIRRKSRDRSLVELVIKTTTTTHNIQALVPINTGSPISPRANSYSHQCFLFMSLTNHIKAK